MITLIKSGEYKLIETKEDTKILYLENKMYAWVHPRSIGEILVVSHRQHRLDCTLSIGRYNLYDVKDEPKLTDLQHLELDVGHNTWQGYLLPTGIPSDKKKRARVIPTPQLVNSVAS